MDLPTQYTTRRTLHGLVSLMSLSTLPYAHPLFHPFSTWAIFIDALLWLSIPPLILHLSHIPLLPLPTLPLVTDHGGLLMQCPHRICHTHTLFPLYLYSAFSCHLCFILLGTRMWPLKQPAGVDCEFKVALEKIKSGFML